MLDRLDVMFVLNEKKILFSQTKYIKEIFKGFE